MLLPFFGANDLFDLGHTPSEKSISCKVHQRVLSGTEMLASHCLPISRQQSQACGSPKLCVDDLRERAVVKMAGNAMSVPCVGAFICAAVMALDVQ